MIINLDEIKKLLASGTTGYRIGIETNVKQQTFDAYKNGKDIESMSLKTAIELQKYINSKNKGEK